MPIWALVDNDLQLVPAIPSPPDEKLVTYGEECWVIVTWCPDKEHEWLVSEMQVYGPYSTYAEADLEADKLVLFTPHSILKVDPLNDS